MQKYDFWKAIHFTMLTVASIVGLDEKHIFYSGNSVDIPDYPYIAFNVPSPHQMEQRSADYTFEQFKATINCNFYATSPQFPADACSTLHYMLRDPYYKERFHQHGFVIDAVSDNGASNSDIANANDIYAQNLQIKLRFTIHHRSKLPNIKRTNLDPDIKRTNLN